MLIQGSGQPYFEYGKYHSGVPGNLDPGCCSLSGTDQLSSIRSASKQKQIKPSGCNTKKISSWASLSKFNEALILRAGYNVDFILPKLITVRFKLLPRSTKQIFVCIQLLKLAINFFPCPFQEGRSPLRIAVVEHLDLLPAALACVLSTRAYYAPLSDQQQPEAGLSR